MSRLNGLLGLLIGIFGALAILGVFFKIAKYPNYELYMTIGFMGEAAAFVIMGIFSFINGFTGNDPAADVTVGASPVASSPFPEDFADEFRAALDEATAEFRASLRTSSSSFGQSMEEASTEFRGSMHEMLQTRLGQDFDQMMETVGQDVNSFGEEMRGLGMDMKEARGSVHTMREVLERAATGSLPEDAERLGTGMRQLGDGMSEAGSTVDRLRNDLNEMHARFSAFNGFAHGDGVSDRGVTVTNGRTRTHENAEAA